jgi:hypothetical protein
MPFPLDTSNRPICCALLQRARLNPEFSDEENSDGLGLKVTSLATLVEGGNLRVEKAMLLTVMAITTDEERYALEVAWVQTKPPAARIEYMRHALHMMRRG